MNVQQMAVTQADAQVALRQYKQHRAVYDKKDWEIERIYRQIARGKTVISVADAIRRAGMDEKRRPKLAICQADAQECAFDANSTYCTFGISTGRFGNTTKKLRIDWPDCGYARATAKLPRIPPQHRPTASALSNYHILWEADWSDIPRDPYLLKRIGKDAWVVLAAWDLTSVELNVVRSYQ